ncbi:MAG: hypothetical protein A2840_01210 [Candidatus Buchananbacteria bacterium RIFCSPHIGHO2_01_FULL_47_11b]|uniref:UMP kinase n=1 Tax=Candidatus Buchananbacteria bacterium RIFCSPHIGHO2_01_FULL_47_11b TaxID=1797537 RepID=A0A1G1Y5U5_9BACT|nr:MAG: hypothetical protein A2840_01210 [Candidatus Buchananbacteria bacterium RIFCSPHIGHO2_01_FULL_47_11b]
MNKTVVMSLGGSLIAPDGIDVAFLKQFRQLILDFTKRGNRAIIICGGGDTARNYQAAARKVNPRVSSRDLDWVGIGATKINAELLSAIFGDAAHESIMSDPTKKIPTNKRVIVGAGFLPGSSSDKDAVLAAKAYQADTVINLSNITYVYDKDPSKFDDAKPQKEMSWQTFRTLVGNTWVPGAHVPFDPIAARLAAELKLKLVVMKGSNLANLKKFLSGKPFVGTRIA